MLNRLKGFTLAELLVALLVLGVVATFAIPKVAQLQVSQKRKAIVKEVAQMVSQAYQQYRLEGNQVTASTQFRDFFNASYINYVQRPTLWSDAYDAPLSGSFGSGDECSTSVPCYILHNGALVTQAESGLAFGGTGTTNAINFLVDTDGQATGDSEGSIWLFLYRDGRITHYGSGIANGTKTNYGTYNPDPSQDRPWFSWD